MRDRRFGPSGLRFAFILLALGLAGLAASAAADPPPGESPNLPPQRITQDEIARGEATLHQIRLAGLRIFTTPFNKLDGYGDGPMDPSDTVSPGGRPTLEGNGTFLRVNGLDAQTCFECHSIVSNATVPAKLGIGGVGGSNSNAMFQASAIDPADLLDFDSAAGFNGRFINPPFVFGVGGVELVGLEMTEDLQALKAQAIASPGVVVPLVTKGVDFGTIVADALGNVDTSNVHGVDPDLVVKPFGRKGEFATTRDFDVGALQFHLGMQPVEVVGEGTDPDGDGVTDEIRVGDLSALGVFLSSLDRPFTEKLSPAAERGFRTFQDITCSSCHVPSMETSTTDLPLRFPEVPEDPTQNVYYRVDLTAQSAQFQKNGHGGVTVPLFADLKRHDMGPGLAETFDLASSERNREFTTAKLWGVADTAPYMHDGRATTLTDAILLHGGEAQASRDAFASLGDDAKRDLLAFLRSLRTPQDPLKTLPHGPEDLRGGAELPEGAPSFNP